MVATYNFGSVYFKIEEYAKNEVRLTYDYIQLFCFTSISRGKLRHDPFHISNTYGRMSKGVKTSQRCK